MVAPFQAVVLFKTCKVICKLFFDVSDDLLTAGCVLTGISIVQSRFRIIHGTTNYRPGILVVDLGVCGLQIRIGGLIFGEVLENILDQVRLDCFIIVIQYPLIRLGIMFRIFVEERTR